MVVESERLSSNDDTFDNIQLVRYERWGVKRYEVKAVKLLKFKIARVDLFHRARP
jgi:hypothetical protein